MNSAAAPVSNTVPELLAQRVAESPAAIAFQEEVSPGQWRPITWAEFGQRVEGLRRGMAAAGLRAGDRLALIAPVSLEWELLHHAALALGVVVVGLDAHDLPDRIAGMVELADVTGVATGSPQVLVKLSGERWARCRLSLKLDSAAQPWPAGATPMSWSALAELGAASGDPQLDAPGPDDTATIIFTSGTTGAPKGIAYKHSQLCLAIEAIGNAFPFVGPGSRLLCWLPLSNLFQRIVNLAGMRRGAASYLLDDPRRVMDVVGGVAPDVFIGVPRFYEKLYDGIRERIATQSAWRRRLVEWAWDTGRRSSPYRQGRKTMPPVLRLTWAAADHFVLRHIRAVMGERLQCMVTGSAPTPVHLLEEFYALGWLVLEAYGLSENVLPMAMNRMDDFRFGTVGRPLMGNDIVVTHEGIVQVRGVGVFSGYLGETGRSPFDAKKFYQTGDLGEFDGDGYLGLRGRIADFLKTSTGRRITPGPIEAALQQVDGLDQVVVVGNGRKQLAALATMAEAQRSRGPSARGRLEHDIRAKIAAMSASNRPALIILQQRSLSVDRGELTPNLKVRRTQIESNFRAALDDAYARIDSLSDSEANYTLIIWQPF